MYNKEDKCKYFSTGHPPQQYLAYGKKCTGCRKQDHFKAVYRLIQQEQDQCSRKTIHEIGQEGNLSAEEPNEQDSSLDAVKVKHINLDSVKLDSYPHG